MSVESDVLGWFGISLFVAGLFFTIFWAFGFVVMLIWFQVD